jgi:hypothetical protein
MAEIEICADSPEGALADEQGRRTALSFATIFVE